MVTVKVFKFLSVELLPYMIIFWVKLSHICFIDGGANPECRAREILKFSNA